MSDVKPVGVTVYARLMDHRLSHPLEETHELLHGFFEQPREALLLALEEQLRQAYVAGVSDGFAQAEQKIEELERERDMLKAAQETDNYILFCDLEARAETAEQRVNALERELLLTQDRAADAEAQRGEYSQWGANTSAQLAERDKRIEAMNEERIAQDAEIQALKAWEPENELRDRIEAADKRIEELEETRSRLENLAAKREGGAFAAEQRVEELEEALIKAVVALRRYSDKRQWLNEREYRIIPGVHGNEVAALAIAEIAAVIDAFGARAALARAALRPSEEASDES